MIKGVQKQVIEISRTEHPLFEKATLVVRGGCDAQDAELHREARLFIKRAGSCSFLKRDRRMRRMKGALLLAAGALGGALLMWLMR